MNNSCINGFDPIAWANLNNNSESKPLPPMSHSGDTGEWEISSLVNLLVSRRIDLTDDYNDWLRVGFALADGLGENGRRAFHDLSRMSSKYNAAQCDKQYDNCLRSHGNGVTVKTLFQMAKDAGIDLSELARKAWQKEQEALSLANVRQSICAKSAKVPSGTNSEIDVNSMENGSFSENVPSGTLALLAQTPETDCSKEMPADCGHTFSNMLCRENLPSFLLPVIDSQSDAAGRDKMLLGTLNLVSGLMPQSLYSIYDRRKVYAPLYNIVFGRFATSKGDLEAVKQIVMPVKREMTRKYEEEMKVFEKELADWEYKNKKERGPQPKEPKRCSPFISANSSASAVYRSLDANGGWGEMFETESDTLANMLSKSEYGDYSDLLRKAHHHEAIAMVRVSDHINIELDNPRLSVFLTCTGSQLPILLPAGNVANGLASRFLFYQLPDNKVEFRDVFAGCDNPIEDIYKDLGNKLLPLYHALQMREDNPIQFVMSKAQQMEFVQTFDAVLREQFSMLGDGIQGFIFRLALECFRYAMVLTALRKLSEWDAQDSIFDDIERALPCDDRDFHTAMTIINCLVNHTARVYAVLATKDNDPFSKVAEAPSNELSNYYKSLPEGREFAAAEAMGVAYRLNIPERTAKRFLGDMVAKYQVLGHPRRGVYVKIECSPSDGQ